MIYIICVLIICNIGYIIDISLFYPTCSFHIYYCFQFSVFIRFLSVQRSGFLFPDTAQAIFLLFCRQTCSFSIVLLAQSQLITQKLNIYYKKMFVLFSKSFS